MDILRLSYFMEFAAVKVFCGTAGRTASFLSGAPALGAGLADVAGEDFGLLMFMIMIALAVFVAAAIAIVIVAGLVLLLIAVFGLGALGLSLYTGLRTKSMQQGWRTFCLSVGIICAIPTAILINFLASFIFDYEIGVGMICVVIVTGAVAGLCIGWAVYAMTQLILRAIGRRLRQSPGHS